MAVEFTYAEGATPLDPDEVAGLIPESVTTVAQLNVFEAENILHAVNWLGSGRPKEVLDDGFLRALRGRMFGNTWRWAGGYRHSEKNIGIAPERISVAVRNLVEDFRVQVEAKAVPIDELAARFHHRLVAIHPFANGNGRHARLAADLLLEQHGAPVFTWGAADLVAAGPVRQAYIAALQAADAKDFSKLFAFVRT